MSRSSNPDARLPKVRTQISGLSTGLGDRRCGLRGLWCGARHGGSSLCSSGALLLSSRRIRPEAARKDLPRNFRCALVDLIDGSTRVDLRGASSLSDSEEEVK